MIDNIVFGCIRNQQSLYTIIDWTLSIYCVCAKRVMLNVNYIFHIYCNDRKTSNTIFSMYPALSRLFNFLSSASIKLCNRKTQVIRTREVKDISQRHTCIPNVLFFFVAHFQTITCRGVWAHGSQRTFHHEH